MKIEKNNERLIFKFNPLKSLIIDNDSKKIIYWEGEIPFNDVVGYWKNYHPGGGLFVYYVMLLTPKKIHKITPELKDESQIDKILDYLKSIIPREVSE